MSGGDPLLKTIAAVHAAGLDETLWPAALAATARLFGARAATLEDFEKQPMRLRYLKTAGVPPHGEIAYLEYYARNNTRAQFAFQNLTKKFICDYEFTDESAMDRDPYYAKYLGPLGLRYFLSGQITNTAEHQAIVSIQRSRRQGHVGQPDIARLELLVPHFRQAYDVTRRLADAGARSRTLEEALSWLRDGVAVLRRDGTVLFANEALQEIARRNDGLRITDNRIEFDAPAAGAHFAQALGAAARLADQQVDCPTDFVAARPHGAPGYIVSLRPAMRGHDGAASMVFIRDPLARAAGDRHLLRALYGLTEAEAALACALCAGMSPVQYAHANRLSANTVYTHLRRLKDKTGCRRLPELVRKLGHTPLPLR